MKKKEKEQQDESFKEEPAKQESFEEGHIDEELVKNDDKASGSLEAEKEIPEMKKDEYVVLWDKYLRLQAEFDNYRKRSYKERAEFIKFANEGLILELLDILDNFERGIKAAELKKDFDLLHQGVDMISKQLHLLLEVKGLNRIKPLGQKFDPHQHEAVEVVEKENAEEDIVIEEMQPGYILNGRIIRTAKVKVNKKSSQSAVDSSQPIDDEEKAEDKKQKTEDEEADTSGEMKD